MTFSANPARTSFLDRLRRLSGPQRALFNVVIAALVLMLCATLLALFLVRAVVHEQAAQLGGALASESARRAAEYLVHDDLVSLSVITGGLTHLPGVVGVTVFDRHRQPLAQSGLVQQTPGLLLAAADIVTEENDLRGSVEILIDPRAALPALARFDYTLLGWLGFSVAFLLIVARLQRDNLNATQLSVDVPAATIAEMPIDEYSVAAADVAGTILGESPLSHLPEGPLLRLEIANYANLEQRLAPRILGELVRLYSDTLASACTFYQGQVYRPLDHQCLVSFPLAGHSDEEALFRAVCCAQLFFGVVRELNESRRDKGKQTMQFNAALHHDASLSSEARALVTWEICNQAGTAGRLTVTDSVSDQPLLGERLLLDNANRHLLQIELPASDGSTPRLQDVLALSVIRLAEPYEELLARQVRRLAEPVAG